MAWSSADVFGVWISLLILFPTAALSIYAWRRRHLPGAMQFAVASAFAALWVACSAAEYAAGDLSAKVFWYKLQVLWQMPTITAIAWFTLEYSWPGRWLTRRNMVLLSVAPLLMSVLILTNDFHHLMWLSLTTDGAIVPIRGPANWLLVLYAGILGLLQIIPLVSLLIRSPSHRWPAAIMIATLVVNRVGYAIKATHLPLADRVPYEVLLVGLACVTFAIALFGFRILNPIPQARFAAIEQMRDGMVVADFDGRVASINPAAQAMLGVSMRSALGRPVGEVLPAECDVGGALGANGAVTVDCAIGAGATTRQVLVVASDLRDWRGLVSGRLVLLRDMTEERRAQVQILEQQRSLAILTERERLAREMHDSLGQTLAAAHLQACTARVLLDRGDTAKTDEHLASLADMMLEAEVDVREYILGAKIFHVPGVPFFEALRRYVERFG